MSAPNQPRRDWAWASLGALVALCVVTAGTLIAWLTASDEHGRIEENRAIATARAVAYVAGHRSPAEVGELIRALESHLGDGLREAYFLGTGEVDRFGLSTGNRYTANLDPDLVGADPRRATDPRQKDIFDRTEAALGSAERYLAQVRRAAEGGLESAAPYFVIREEVTEDGLPFINVSVPVVAADGDLAGVAGVSIRQLRPGQPLPWGGLILTLVLAGGALFLVGTLRNRFAAVPYVMFGGMIALMVAVSMWVVGWERNAYGTHLAEYASEANVVMRAAVEHSDEGAVSYALRDYRDARVHDLTTLPFSAERAERTASAPETLVAAYLLLGLALLGLHGFIVRTFRQLAKSPWAYVYVFPSMVGMLVLVFGPFLFGVALSFHERDAGRFVFVAFRHFVDILGGERSSEVTFYWTLFVTFFWTITNVVIHVVSGLVLALILHDPLLRFKKFYRVFLILPWAIPNYITALIWRGLFDTDNGAVNQFLAIFGIGGVDWLGGSFLSAFTANLVTNCWLGFPFMMVVALGALQSIPDDLYEAADVDGATRWQKFRTITLPLLKPALFPAIILGSIWTFNMFNIIYLVSGGGPSHSTEILITEAYKAFYVLGRWGYAAAYSVMIFVILLLFSSVMNRVSRATEGAFD